MTAIFRSSAPPQCEINPLETNYFTSPLPVTNYGIHKPNEMWEVLISLNNPSTNQILILNCLEIRHLKNIFVKGVTQWGTWSSMKYNGVRKADPDFVCLWQSQGMLNKHCCKSFNNFISHLFPPWLYARQAQADGKDPPQMCDKCANCILPSLFHSILKKNIPPFCIRADVK